MKKLINAVDTVLAESLDGFAAAHADIVTLGTDRLFVRRKTLKPGKVALLSGGGSGHEPLHAGFVGHGMLDAACPGQVFTSPTPDQMAAAVAAIDQGKGTLFIVKNYEGDVMNFEMAADMTETPVKLVVVDDDVAVEKSTYSIGRRGVAGTMIVERIVGAAAEQAGRLGLRGIDLMISEEWAPHRRSIERAGFSYAYGDLDMLCAVPNWGQDVALPEDLAWRDLEPGLVDDFLRIYRAAFAGLPGVYFPDEAEQRRVLTVGRGVIRVLCGDDRVLAALRYAPDGAFLHSIVRDPAVKGRGFGRLVLDEARRCLPGRALSLNVVSSNRAALDLYRRHGFAITADRDVLTKSLTD